MFALQGSRQARAALALTLVLVVALLVSGIASAPAQTANDRCGDKVIDRTALDPTGGDPTIVVIGFNSPTEGDDVIFGTNGADTINGKGGHDVICGFDGADTIHGGTGDDTVFGGNGADKIHGDDGNDQLFGEAGADDLQGDTGDDQLFGGDDGDGLDGGQGNDTLFGEAANDTLTGAGGDDVIFGGDGGDTLDGGDGNDQLTAEAGDDKLLGGGGDDQLFAGDGADDLQAGDGLDHLDGGDGNDTIDAGAGEDKVFGGGGNDVMHGGAGPDDMSGDAGDDQVFGDAGEDSVAGGDGIDRLDGGDGNDTLSGDAGDDTVLGSAGDDGLFGGDGNDTLNGGGGGDGISGGAGVDRADYSDIAGGGISADLATGEVTGSAGADTLSEIENVTGTQFDDTLTGSAANNVLSGGAGNDTIDGGLGNDTENGDDGNDTFVQSGEVGNGADVMNGGAGIDTVDYTSRELPVTVTRDGVANDGVAGEGDNVMPDIENVNLRPVLNPTPQPTPDLSAPVLSNFKVNATRFSPNGDGRLDEFIASGRFSESTQWTFDVLSGTTVLFSEAGEGLTMKAAWNGVSGEGRNAVSATYRWRLTGKDSAGNQVAARTGTITIDRSRPRVRSVRISRKRLDLSRRRSTQIRFSVPEAATFRVRIRRGAFVRTFGPRKLEEAGTVVVNWNGRSAGGAKAKPGRYRVEVGVRDLAGNLTVARSTIIVVR